PLKQGRPANLGAPLTGLASPLRRSLAPASSTLFRPLENPGPILLQLGHQRLECCLLCIASRPVCGLTRLPGVRGNRSLLVRLQSGVDESGPLDFSTPP